MLPAAVPVYGISHKLYTKIVRFQIKQYIDVVQLQIIFITNIFSLKHISMIRPPPILLSALGKNNNELNIDNIISEITYKR